MSRQYSGDGSNYDSDPEDRPPLPAHRSFDKPRTGKLKIVGDDSESENWAVHSRTPEPTMDIPNVDFGPTRLYQPEFQAANKSTERLQSHSPTRTGYNQSRLVDSYNRSPSRSPLPTPDGGHSRSTSAIAWQPAAGGTAADRAVTPDQYVQQKATANRVPVYAHTRQPSSPGPRSHSRGPSHTPPSGSRNSSADWTQQASRPDSRGGNAGQPPDYSRYLSAREQEQVARATGSPLINIERKPHSPAGATGGLIGAIEAREQEKKAAKEGYGGHMVQQAIAQRQQQQAHQGQQYPPEPSPQYAMPGQFPETPQYAPMGWNQMQQQQAPYAQSQYQGYAGPSYGRQTPQDYYRQQSHNNLPQYQTQGQGQHQNQGQSQSQRPYGEQGNQSYQSHR